MRIRSCKYFIIGVVAAVMIISPFVCRGQNYHSRHARYSVSIPEGRRIKLKDSLLNVLNSNDRIANNQVGKKPLTYKQKSLMLMNICDLSSGDSSAFIYAKQLLRLASANHDLTSQVEALLTLCTDNQPELQKYLNVAMRLPKRDISKEIVELYLYRIAVNSKAAADDKSRVELVKDYIKKFTQNDYSDNYDKAGNLLILCKLISLSTKGELLSKYLSYAGNAIKALPINGSYILSLFYYTQSATYYADHDMQKEALASDMQLLRIYNELANHYKKQGRTYISLNQYRYLCFRRILTYNRVLSGAQLDIAFGLIKDLAATDRVLYNDLYASNSIGLARYYFSKKEYKKAIPYLDAALESNADSLQWRIPETLKMRVKAGIALNDTSMHKYLIRYADYLNKSKQAGVSEKEAEMDVLYDVSNLKQRSNNKLLSLIILSVIILFFAIIMLTRLLLRSKKIKSSLRTSHVKLQEEKAIISKTMVDLMKAEDMANKANKMKTLFLQNMNHEIRTPLNSIIGFSQLIASSGKDMSQPEASTYVDLISKNSKLLLTIISDVIDISTMETGEMNFVRENFSVNEMCTASVRSVEKNVQPGVELSFCKHETDTIMCSDMQRVQQVILNYLTNACKFTSKGSIVLDYYADNLNITFSVTDTGIGVPRDKMDLIFNRFEKLNSFSQGTGLGLHICKLIAKGLHGRAFVDRDYCGGSRFLFAMPLDEISNLDFDNTAMYL